MTANATIRQMEYHALQPGCWPTDRQELLLKACLLEGHAATDAWQKWKSLVDIDWIDEGSNRLLPLLYHNLSSLGIEDLVLTRAKGVYRYQLTKTHIMLHRTMPLLRELQNKGIGVILLKGSALILDYYPNFGTRPQLDIDIMVKPDDVDRAASLLVQHGLRCEYRQPLGIIRRFRHSCCFDRGPEIRIDLHWNIMHPFSGEDAVPQIWAQARETRYQDYPLLTMSPTHLLLHTCLHGLRWNRHAPCRWVADAIMIIRNAGPSIDWLRLSSLAKDLRVSVALHAALDYLDTTFRAGTPGEVIADLKTIPAGRLERAAFYVQTRDKSRLYGNLLKYTVDYLRHEHPRGAIKKIVNYPRYLQLCWNTQTFFLMPFELLGQNLRQKLNQRRIRQSLRNDHPVPDTQRKANE